MRLLLGFLSLALSIQAVTVAAAVPVIVNRLEAQPFSQTIEALGTLRAVEGVTLSATVTETVSAIHFRDGQRVKAGDVLVEMTSDEERAMLQEAQATLNEAQRQYTRVQSLIKSGLATESVLDERKQAFEVAEAQLQATKSRLNDRRIVAPFDGLVGLRQISVGTLVRPGDTITTLDHDRVMNLDFSVPAVYLGTLQPGLKVVARADSWGQDGFVGTVSSVDSRIDPATRSIVIRAEIPNAEFKLKAGMLMSVNLSKAETLELLLPEEALVQEGFKKFVFVVQEGEPLRVTRRQIETGPRRRGEIVVTQGLSAGERVVTHGLMHLREGSEVTITGEATVQTNIADMIAEKPGAN